MLNFFKFKNHLPSEEEVLTKEKLKQLKLLQKSKFFNTEWYLSKYTDVAKAGVDPVEHYLMHGANEGRNPSDKFDTLYYIQTYKDVSDSKMNPLLHYINHGKKEGRLCLPKASFIKNQNEQDNIYNYIKYKILKLPYQEYKPPISKKINNLHTLRDSCPLSREIHRPLLIIGGGPSNAYFDNRRVPANPVIFRVNLFMLESDYRFGQHVDAVFWSIYRRILHSSLQVVMECDSYQINNFFRPPDLMKNSLPIFKEETATHARLFSPKFWHWDLFRLIPEFDEFFFNRKHGGLPTTGLQALAVGLILGFRNIYISGIDFYGTLDSPGSNSLQNKSRYSHELPDYLKCLIAKEHNHVGYEVKSHSEEIDTIFFKMLVSLYPDAKINCTAPESPLSKITELAPVHTDHFIPATTVKTKDLKNYHKLNRNLLYKNYAPLGYVELIDKTIQGWAWDPKKPYDTPRIQLLNESDDVLEEFSPELYLHKLDMAGIGQATCGFTHSIANHIDTDKNKLLYVRYKNGPDLDGSPISLINEASTSYLKAPRRKASSRNGIQSISKGSDHYWYVNNDSLSANKHHAHNSLPDTIKHILVISNDLSLITGVARSISHYMNALLNVDSIDFTSIELEMDAPANTIESNIENADFVIINSIGLFMNHPDLAEVVAKCGPRRSAIYIHETSWGLNLFEELQPERYADLLSYARQFNFFCVSQKQANYIRAIFGAMNINVIYETTSLPKSIYAAPSNKSLNTRNPLRIVMSGTLQPRKGVTLFSRVADIAAEKNLPWEFYWVGHEVKKYVNDSYKSKNVEFIGRLDGKEYLDFLQECDIFFLSSEDDPFPLSCLEAIKCYKRLIVFKGTGISEILYGINGARIYKDYVPEAAFKALHSVAASKIDIELYSALNERFNIANFVQRFNRAITNCVSGNYTIEIDHNYIVISHHPKDFSRGVCNSIYQLFSGSDKYINPLVYLNPNNSCESFLFSLQSNLSKSPVIVFNGIFSLMFENSIKSLELARKNNLKVVIYWHETAWNIRTILGKNSEGRRNIVKKLNILLSAIDVTNWVTSSQCMHAVATIFGFPIEKFRVVHEIIDLSRFKLQPPNYEAKKKLIIAGSGIPDVRKGIDRYHYLAKYISTNLSENFNCEFRWHLSGPDQIIPVQYVKTSEIKWMNYSENFHEELSKSDLFILTSRDDPFPLVALEALATGRPVFAFNSTGFVEVLPDWLIAKNLEDMAEKIISYIENPRMDPDFYRNIAEQFSVEHFINKAFINKEDELITPLPHLQLF